MKNYFIISIILFAGCSFYAVAQDQSNPKGEVVTGEVVVEKHNKKIVLPKADKQYFQAEKKSFDSGPMEIMLNVTDSELSWPPYKADIPYQKVTKFVPPNSYNNYARAGLGNYSSSLFEVGLFEELGRFSASGKVFYEGYQIGSINESGNNKFTADLFAIYDARKLAIQPHLYIENKQYRFYGNTDRINTGFNSGTLPKVNLLNIDFKIMLKGSVNNVKYYLSPAFNRIDQNIRQGLGDINEESVLGGDGGLELKLDEHFTTGLDIEGKSSKYRGGVEYDRALFILSPWINYTQESLWLKGGFNLSAESLRKRNQTRFYPEFVAGWKFADKYELYANLSGTVEWIGLNNLLFKNEFLDDSLFIMNVEHAFALSGGMKASLFKSLALGASLSFDNLRHLPFYVPSGSDFARYVIAYDSGSVKNASFRADVSYMPSGVSSYQASLTLNNYSVSSQDRSWHLPAYELKLNASHKIKEKLLFSTNLLALGGLKAPAKVDFGIVNLKAILDISIHLKYLITERASAWVEINNVGNVEYERYLGYPVRGISFKIGAMHRF